MFSNYKVQHNIIGGTKRQNKVSLVKQSHPDVMVWILFVFVLCIRKLASLILNLTRVFYNTASGSRLLSFNT